MWIDFKSACYCWVRKTYIPKTKPPNYEPNLYNTSELLSLKIILDKSWWRYETFIRQIYQALQAYFQVYSKIKVNDGYFENDLWFADIELRRVPVLLSETACTFLTSCLSLFQLVYRMIVCQISVYHIRLTLWLLQERTLPFFCNISFDRVF